MVATPLYMYMYYIRDVHTQLNYLQCMYCTLVI